MIFNYFVRIEYYVVHGYLSFTSKPHTYTHSCVRSFVERMSQLTANMKLNMKSRYFIIPIPQLILTDFDLV